MKLSPIPIPMSSLRTFPLQPVPVEFSRPNPFPIMSFQFQSPSLQSTLHHHTILVWCDCVPFFAVIHAVLGRRAGKTKAVLIRIAPGLLVVVAFNQFANVHC